MLAIVDAIQARVDGADGAALRALVNEVSYGDGSTRATEPFVRFYVIDETVDACFGQSGTPRKSEEARIQFSIFVRGNDVSGLGAIETALKALFDWCALTVTGSSHVVMQPLGTLTQSGNDGCFMSVDYLVRGQAS